MNRKRIEKNEEWAPTIWLGAHPRALGRLFWRHPFAAHPSRWPIAVFDSLLSLGHGALGVAERVIYRRRVREAVLREDPIFILGHWRTGTTWLHQLLAVDPRHGFPTTYDCLAPCDFLLTGRWFPRWFPWLLPSRRPMDAVALSWDSPQEDEFALALLGIPSPYSALAFPNRKPLDDAYLDFDGLDGAAIARWKREFGGFLRRLSARERRRLVLKSPPHTARVPVLREMFPKARFIYLSRDPHRVFASTLHLWKTLYRRNGFQIPDYRGLQERVLSTYLRLQQRWESARAGLPEGLYHEIRYEDLVRDPIGEIERLYAKLELDGFSDVRPLLERHLERTRDYRTNQLELSEREKALVSLRWRAEAGSC